MEAEQAGLCFLCGKAESVPRRKGEPRMRDLAIDHDHATGKVRRLLCHHCNTGLGKFFDNPEILRKAADYVEHFRREI